MNIQEFEELYGRDELKAVAIKAGSNWAYMDQLLRKVRRPSVDLAQSLVDASENRLDFVSMLKVKIKKQKVYQPKKEVA